MEESSQKTCAWRVAGNVLSSLCKQMKSYSLQIILAAPCKLSSFLEVFPLCIRWASFARPVASMQQNKKKREGAEEARRSRVFSRACKETSKCGEFPWTH